MKKIYQAIVLCMSFFAICTAYADTAFNLQQLVEKTVASSPEVQARYHTFKAAEQEQNAARGGYYPRADIISTFRSQERVFPNTANTETPNSQTQLVIRQMLFDGFITRGEVNRLGHAARVRYYELQSSMQGTALEVVRAYLDVQRYRQLSSYAQDNYVAHKQLFDRIEERVTAGVARRVDLEQASGRLALAEANLLTESTNLQNVTARYQRLTGELPPSNLPEVDFYNAGTDASPVAALQQAYQRNPDILAAIENIVATQQEVESRKGRYYPRLDLQGTKNLYTSNNGQNSLAAADTLALTATFNLFNGFSDKAVISQAVEKLNNSQDLRDKACVDTRQTVVIAYNDISSLKEQLNYRDQHQLSIEKAREAYRKQFDIGQRTLLDLLDTENEYFQARRTYTITERDLYTAYARTYASQGDLLTKLGVVRGDLPEMQQADYMDNYKICQAVAPDVPMIDKAALVANAKPLNTGSLANEKMAASKAPILNDSEAIKAAVTSWAEAWRNKDIESYLGFYSAKFVPENKVSRNVWTAQRKKRFAAPGAISLVLENMDVKVDGNTAKAAFYQRYSSNGYSDNVNKVLHIERSPNGSWLIVREEVVLGTIGMDQSKQQIEARVGAWAEAWQRKDLEAYLKFYSENFEPKKLGSKEAWLAQRKQRLSEAQGDIDLKLEKIKVSNDGEKAVASFVQRYKSPQFSDVMNKSLNLELAKIDNDWMIIRETNR